MPDSVISSSPAWDPASRTPIAEPEIGEQLVAQPSRVAHPLLDPRLVGKKFRVIADGGNFKQKEIVVDITLVHGQLSTMPYHYLGTPSQSAHF
jgi:hypothetical protein